MINQVPVEIDEVERVFNGIAGVLEGEDSIVASTASIVAGIAAQKPDISAEEIEPILAGILDFIAVKLEALESEVSPIN